MAPGTVIQEALQDLNDLELAVVVSLVAEEHCIFSTDEANTATLQNELRSICVHTFGLQPAIVHCSTESTVDELNESILIENESDNEYLAGRDESPFTTRKPGDCWLHILAMLQIRAPSTVSAFALDILYKTESEVGHDLTMA